MSSQLPVHGLFFAVECVWLCCLTYVIGCVSSLKHSVYDGLYLLTTQLPVYGQFFAVECVWLCCLTYVIGCVSMVKASFKHISILIIKVGKKSLPFTFCLYRATARDRLLYMDSHGRLSSNRRQFEVFSYWSLFKDIYSLFYLVNFYF